MIRPSRLLRYNSGSELYIFEFARKPTNKEAVMIKGNSVKIDALESFTGRIIAVTPKIRKILAILLPNTFPMAIPELPLKLAIKLTINSGKEVPKETTVSPIVISEIFIFFATAEDPVTKKSAPFTRHTNPKTNKIYIHICIINLLNIDNMLNTGCLLSEFC